MTKYADVDKIMSALDLVPPAVVHALGNQLQQEKGPLAGIGLAFTMPPKLRRLFLARDVRKLARQNYDADLVVDLLAADDAVWVAIGEAIENARLAESLPATETPDP